MSRLSHLGPDIWTAEGPVVCFYGFRYPTRMAAIRLEDGGLFIWSPVALDGVLRTEIEALGPVRHLVSPNKLHHLYLAEWQRAFPDALLWAPPGLARKRRDLGFAGALGDGAPPQWDGQIAQCLFAGSFFLTEIVFFHRASGTALFADLIQNFPPGWFHGWRGLVARLDGIVVPDFGAPREWRWSFLNRAAARRSLARIHDWQARQVVIAHGKPCDGDAFIRRAFGWLA